MVYHPPASHLDSLLKICYNEHDRSKLAEVIAMASWMVHLRIADALIDKIADIDKTAFVMGNIAPDSGVPNDD